MELRVQILEKKLSELEKLVIFIDDDLTIVENVQVEHTQSINSLINKSKDFMTAHDRNCLIEIFAKYKDELEPFMDETKTFISSFNSRSILTKEKID